MKRTLIGILIVTGATATLRAEEATNSTSQGQAAISTNFNYDALSTEELARRVLKPPESKAPIATTPTLYDTAPQPPLSPDAIKHQYLGFRLGMSVEEAGLLAQTSGKKLEALEPDKKYSLDGCLTDVPRPDRARTILAFREGKLDLAMLFWDDDRTLYYNLQPILERKYGRPLKADELFRRYWILENDDCIRLLYEVAAHQTSVVYGSKEAVFRLNEEEKREISRDYKGL